MISVQAVLGTTQGLIPAQDNLELVPHSIKPGSAEEAACPSTAGSSPPCSNSPAGPSTLRL